MFGLAQNESDWRYTQYTVLVLLSEQDSLASSPPLLALTPLAQPSSPSSIRMASLELSRARDGTLGSGAFHAFVRGCPLEYSCSMLWWLESSLRCHQTRLTRRRGDCRRAYFLKELLLRFRFEPSCRCCLSALDLRGVRWAKMPISGIDALSSLRIYLLLII